MKKEWTPSVLSIWHYIWKQAVTSLSPLLEFVISFVCISFYNIRWHINVLLQAYEYGPLSSFLESKGIKIIKDTAASTARRIAAVLGSDDEDEEPEDESEDDEMQLDEEDKKEGDEQKSGEGSEEDEESESSEAAEVENPIARNRKSRSAARVAAERTKQELLTMKPEEDEEDDADFTGLERQE